MANINDFKLLNASCLKYFDLIIGVQNFEQEKISQLSDINKKRFGFYYFILHNLTSIDDWDIITDCICDQDFNLKLFGKPESDEGIDAVYINEEDCEINLFNFKFREKFNVDKQQSKDEAILSSKFLSVLKTENNTLKGKIKQFADTIIDKYNSKTEWKTRFYIISNENVTLSPDDKNLKDFADLFDVSIECIGLDKISSILLPKHKNISAMVNIASEGVMSYSETSRSSNISYIVRMRLTELIRITCNNEVLRNNYQLEDEKVLANVKEETDVLFENVRSLILKSKYNKNIEETLKNEPTKFFFYNNGITIVAENVDYQDINSGKRIKLCLQNFQVLNGGQTLRTIHSFNQQNPLYISDNLSKAEILVRILKVTDSYLKNKIGEYTNSQNAIKVSDLKALRKEQLELDKFLADNNIMYVRKRGDDGVTISRTFKHVIGMERLGQILWTAQGYPEMVSNKKSDIFTIRYDSIFGTDELISQKTVDLINLYFEIKESYKQKSYSFTEQKCMYCLYISHFTNDNSYSNIIDRLEAIINDYLNHNGLKLSPARVLIQTKFKETVDTIFGIQSI